MIQVSVVRARILPVGTELGLGCSSNRVMLYAMQTQHQLSYAQAAVHMQLCSWSVFNVFSFRFWQYGLPFLSSPRLLPCARSTQIGRNRAYNSWLTFIGSWDGLTLKISIMTYVVSISFSLILKAKFSMQRPPYIMLWSLSRTHASLLLLPKGVRLWKGRIPKSCNFHSNWQSEAFDLSNAFWLSNPREQIIMFNL